MADKTVTIKSADGDYTSLNAAFAGEDDINADLTATGMNGILTFECWNFEDTTAATTGTGYTTDSTHYLDVIGRAADKTSSNTGKWSTDRYRCIVSTSGANNGIIGNHENYTRLTDLQTATNSTEGAIGFQLGGDETVGGVIALRCITYAQQANTGFGFHRATTSSEVAKIYAINCIAIGGWTYGYYMRGNDASYGIYTYSCTAYGCATGFRARSSYCYAKNCLSIGCTDAFLESTAYAAADYCCFDEGTDPGTNGTDLSAYTDDEIFVDADNATVLSKDCHLCAGSQAIGKGTNTSGESDPLNFTTDVDGDSRGETWDCGADEYVAAGGGSNILPFMMAYHGG